MNTSEPNQERQERKQTAFKIMKNVREHCEKTRWKKFLMLTLATYCNKDGICWPGNAKLAQVMGTSKSTVERTLRRLRADNEVHVAFKASGKRIIKLNASYLSDLAEIVTSDHPTHHPTHVRAVTCRPRQSCDVPILTANGTTKGKERGLLPKAQKPSRSSFVPRYPESAEEGYLMLEAAGVEPQPDYDGNFFEEMLDNNWTLPNGKRVHHWIKCYQARLEKTSPENFYGRA